VQPSRREVPATQAWIAFAAWAVVGAGVSLGTLTVLTIGLFVLPATAVIAALIAIWRRSVAEAAGALSGLALPLFYVSYLNRNGPGEVCTTIPGGSDCTDEWSPWPFLIAGALLAIVGVAAFLMIRRHLVRRARTYAAGG
jgi:hypothetical protein